MHRRYARQVSLPEIGEAGQARLLAARVENVRNPTTREYLERAGVVLAPIPAHENEGRSETAALVGAFAAVEEIKRILGVGVAGRLEESFE